jgi:hypothetical protein
MKTKSKHLRLLTILLFVIAINAITLTAHTQSLTLEFDTAGYTLTDLGSITDLPAQYGGLTIKPNEPDILYIGGNANYSNGALYAVPLVRDESTNNIIGFGGPATLIANTPNIDGGVTFASNGTLLFTRYSMNELGQILPDNSYINTPLSTYGVASSVGSLAFVPEGFPGAGNLIFSSYNASVLYQVPFTTDVSGQFNLSAKAAEVSVNTTASGPEGIAYIPEGSTAFPNFSMVISSYSSGKVVVFEVDENGLPDPGTARDMVIGLTGAEGALIDPVTGDFLFSTFGGGNKVIVISGFEAPSSVYEISNSGLAVIRLAPNPTRGKFNVIFNEPARDAVVSIINALGEIVLQKTISEIMAQEFDISNEPAGFYLVRISERNATITRQILLQ